MATNEETVREFWRLFDEADYDKAGKLMKADAVVWWPNTREVFRGAAAFMSVNRNYPGRRRSHLRDAGGIGGHRGELLCDLVYPAGGRVDPGDHGVLGRQ